MNLNAIIEYCRIKAIEKALLPDEESAYKSFCRAYSKRFHTPLPQVYLLPPEEVISQILEDNHDEKDIFENIEEVLEQIYTMEDPNYSARKKVDMDSFIEIAAQREQGRIKHNKEVLEERVEKLAPTKNKGGVDFSNLNEDNEK